MNTKSIHSKFLRVLFFFRFVNKAEVSGLLFFFWGEATVKIEIAKRGMNARE